MELILSWGKRLVAPNTASKDKRHRVKPLSEAQVSHASIATSSQTGPGGVPVHTSFCYIDRVDERRNSESDHQGVVNPIVAKG